MWNALDINVWYALDIEVVTRHNATRWLDWARAAFAVRVFFWVAAAEAMDPS